MDYPCYKIRETINEVKNLNKIKNIINQTLQERNNKIRLIKINEEEKKKITKDLDKNISQAKVKYNIIHNKLYDIINILVKNECAMDENNLCEKGLKCLKKKDNEEIWNGMDYLISKIQEYYIEVETKLVLELELCLFKINKIKKIDYLNE